MARYRSAEAFRRALETRLLTLSTETGRSLVRLRKEVVFDRLLARLLTAAPGSWLLKGGLALDYRFGDRARTTKDIDIAMAGGEDGATEAVLASQAVDLDDFFVFSLERSTELDELQEGAAVRYQVRSELAGRLFEEFLLDVGFDTPKDVGVETVRGPDLLAFADIAPVEVPALMLEIQVAEKLHAYTRTYGQAGTASSRVKDLVDLALIATSASLDGHRLLTAIEETFASRGSHDVPATVPRPSPDWSVPYGRMAREIGINPDPDAGFQLASMLLNPLLARVVEARIWEPTEKRWAR